MFITGLSSANNGAPTGARRLIVNADGFGFGAGATQGIIDAVREGRFITSVSVNANFPEAERVRDLVKEFPKLSVGVHLNPMIGRPCLSPKLVPSLVGPGGFFHNGNFLWLLRKGRISFRELEAEFDAQIHVVKDLVRERLTHLDSQENTHLQYFRLALKLTSKWQLRCIRNNASLICLESSRPRTTRLSVYLRKPHVALVHLYRRHQMQKARSAGLRMADDLITVGYAGTGGKTRANNWRHILENLSPGTHEVYCHPAYPDDTLRRWSTYFDERATELAILRAGDLREMASKLGIELISFDDL